MKLLVQLLFFAIALLLTFLGLISWFAVSIDAMSGSLANYTQEESMYAAVGLIICPLISIIIYFMLWKTNFFTRNNSYAEALLPHTSTLNVFSISFCSCSVAFSYCSLCFESLNAITTGGSSTNKGTSSFI